MVSNGAELPSSWLVPAILAVLGGVVLAALLLAPFVYRSYRRRGELGLGASLLAFSFLVYGLALVAYTLLPLPVIDEAWCADHRRLTTPQLDPARFLDDIADNQLGTGVHSVLANVAVQQVVFNVALFVPLGAFLRLYFRERGVPAVVLAGFVVSLLIELTQLTGNWFLFPCPYRLFDVDDLLANTLGTAIGVLFTPLLRKVHGRNADLPADAPRPVTTGRRWLGMLVDLVAVFVLGGFIGTTVNLLAHYALDGEPVTNPVAVATLTAWSPAVLLLALPSLGPAGATLGQRAVRLRRVRPDGSRAGIRVVPALLSGGFGYYALSGLGGLVPAASTVSSVMVVVCAVLAWRPRSHRGLSGLVAGLVVVDARSTRWPEQQNSPVCSKEPTDR